jgi:hypothetical protein
MSKLDVSTRAYIQVLAVDAVVRDDDDDADDVDDGGSVAMNPSDYARRSGASGVCVSASGC